MLWNHYGGQWVRKRRHWGGNESLNKDHVIKSFEDHSKAFLFYCGYDWEATQCSNLSVMILRILTGSYCLCWWTGRSWWRKGDNGRSRKTGNSRREVTVNRAAEVVMVSHHILNTSWRKSSQRWWNADYEREKVKGNLRGFRLNKQKSGAPIYWHREVC